jgi:hypothetical protein
MLYETDAGDLIDFAKRWAELGAPAPTWRAPPWGQRRVERR